MPSQHVDGDQHNDADATTLRCLNCGTTYRLGELACQKCGFVFSNAGRTTRIGGAEDVALARAYPKGEVTMAEQKPIIFEINGHPVTLPVADIVTVGRANGPTDPDQPHVDLSAFEAEDRGVSRVHLRVRRKGILVYVSDLHSTNGTHLNGRKLIPDGERLLRDGDELYLSRMLIKVRF